MKPEKLRQCDDSIDAPISSKSRNECSRSLVMDEDGFSNSSSWDAFRLSFVELKVEKELGNSDVFVGIDVECDLATCPCRNPEVVFLQESMALPST